MYRYIQCLIFLMHFYSSGLCCTASAHHKVISARKRMLDSNNIIIASSSSSDDSIPSLFTFDHGPKAEKLRRMACASKTMNLNKDNICRVVIVNVDAFDGDKFKFPLDSQDLNRFLILKKVSQEGIEFLHSPTGGGPTVLTYRNNNSTELFVSRAGTVFGSVEVTSGGGRLHLAPCPNCMKPCQLLIFRKNMPKERRIST